ncbi:quinoprotein relay system zinc metallohydrolase 2 [Aerophototrophica crusticola]|uniref:Quinoprotein relay system zinc metallohydrolase 2 n=1 Tax=Aerophototrophica crusticola TaxID=1709002 RepID=A0A858R3K2_9PROT|nr:quinoprotein relay system zinc metallohydrolase 2 [Rhodospirillaceae bacterium B3]
MPRLALTLLLLLLLPGPAWAVEPLPVTEVAPGVFVHRGVHEESGPANGGDIANIGFVVGRDAVAVVDSGGTPGIARRLLAAVRAKTDRPVRYVINTHMHPDHVLGNGALAGEGVTFAGHANLPAALSARFETYVSRAKDHLGEAPVLVLPTLLVKDRAEIDLGGRVLDLAAHPTAHTNNDLTVLDRQTGTLWAGDLLFRERHPSLDGSVKGWLALLDRLVTVQATQVIPGHGPVAEWPEAVEPLRAYLAQVVGEVRALQKEGVGIAHAVPRVAVEAKTRWELWETYHPQLVTAAYAELEWE